MVTRGMPPFWVTFNPSDLRCPIILWLASVAVGCSESTTSAFCHAIAIINPVAVATFFHETCRGIFNYLLKAGSSDGDLFGSVLAYFGIVETNGRSMLYLHCLVWLKGISSFSDLCRKIADEDGFKIRLLLFVDQVIRYKLTPVDTNQVLPKVVPSASATPDGSIFASQLKDNTNLVASQVQMHSWTHNATCFKYDHNKTQCRFNFSRLIIPDSYINDARSIFL